MADRSGKRYRSSSGSPLKARPLRVAPETDAALTSVASTLGLSYNALANEALTEWLAERAPERLAAARAEADAEAAATADAAARSAAMIRQLSGEDTTTP